MPSSTTYLVPARTVRVEQVIKKSRFIAVIGRAENRTKANLFIQNEREAYPDARHHCWAYIAGNPRTSIDIGMSDDGEPQGTAGKPILNVLQQSSIGEIVAVVIRYFGGVKLGTGGLFRAYSGTVQLALKAMATTEHATSKKACIVLPYALENEIRHLLEQHHIVISDKIYAETVTYHIEVPEKLTDLLSQQVADLTRGEIAVDWQ